MTKELFLVSMMEHDLRDKETKHLLASLDKLDLAVSVVAWDDESIDWSKSPLCIIRTTWNYHKQPAAFRDWLIRIKNSTTLWNSAETILWNMHKGYLIDLKDKGIPIIETVLIRQHERFDLSTLSPQLFVDELVIKPAISASAYGTKKLRRDDEEAQSHLNELLSLGDVLIQPFQKEIKTNGEVSLIYLQHNFTHAVRKTAQPGEYRIQEEYGGIISLHHPSQEELAFGSQILESLEEPVSYARIDILQTEEGLVLMELELIEPDLFLRYIPDGFDRFAKLIQQKFKTLSV